MTLVSVLGYAKSGKTAFVETVVRALVDRGERVAMLKTGRTGHPPGGGTDGSRRSSSTVPDSRRCATAGAQLSLFWSPQGLVEDGESGPRLVNNQPLPPRNDFTDRWLALLPRDLRARIERSSWVFIEGRPVTGAWVVQLATTGELKYPVLPTDYLVTSFEDIPPTVSALIEHRMHTLPAQGGTYAGKE
jgi:hypothetical protein